MITPFSELWSDIKLTLCQEVYWNCEDLLIANYSGRRTGKSELGKRRLIEAASKEPFTEYFYLFPTQKLATALFDLFLPPGFIGESQILINKSQSFVKVNNSRIHIVGCDKLNKYAGMVLDGVVIDESSDILQDVIERTILPMLVHRNGFLHMIGVLNIYQRGYKEYKKFIRNPDVTKFAWKTREICPRVVEEARKWLSDEDFKEQFECQFVG